MNENKLIEEFWRDCDNNNFSKEATVLFYYLLYRYRRDRQETVSINPAALLSLVSGYSVTVEKSVQIDPSRRKNVTPFVEIRLTLGDEIKMTPVGILRR